ncbi:MAG: hypothetical protein WCD18_07915 [Thermosynechococcaceae cyanobacterium]
MTICLLAPVPEEHLMSGLEAIASLWMRTAGKYRDFLAHTASIDCPISCRSLLGGSGMGAFNTGHHPDDTDVPKNGDREKYGIYPPKPQHGIKYGLSSA